MVDRACTAAVTASTKVPRRDRRLTEDCVRRHNCRRIVIQRIWPTRSFTRTDPDSFSLTHGPTRSPRRRCRMGSCPDPADVALPRRQPTEFVGDRFPSPAEHPAEHIVESSHANARPPARLVAPPASCGRWSSRAVAPSSGSTALPDAHSPANRCTPEWRDRQSCRTGFVPLARRPRAGASPDPHGAPARHERRPLRCSPSA